MKNVLSVILSAFLLGTVSLLFIAKKANMGLDHELKSTETSADSVSKWAGILSGNVKKCQEQNDSLSARNIKLIGILGQTISRLATAQNEIGKNKKATEEAVKKYEVVALAGQESEKQLSYLRNLNEQLGQENKNLSSKVSALKDANKELTDQLVAAQAISKDNILIETMKKNGRLILRGKKVKKIVTTLNIQHEIKDPTFRIFDPKGNELPESAGSFDLKTIKDAAPTPASGNSVRIELTYMTSKKMGPGLYKIEMFSENKHMGNLLVRFR